MGPPPATVLEALGLSNSALQDFAEALQFVVAPGVSAAVPFPTPSCPMVKVKTLSLLNLGSSYGESVDGEIPPIWYVVAKSKGRI